MCKRWRESFENFLADMGPRPTPKHSLDRYPDTTGDYELTNCRWADAKEQARNRRGTVKVFWEGKQVPLVEVLEKRNLNERSIRKRLARGWTLDEALTIPMGEKRNEDYPVEWMLVYWGNKK